MKEFNKILLCGPSGSGKSTIANILKNYINNIKNNINNNINHKIAIIDGDLMRNTINSDLGFSKEEILENVRRINELSNFLYYSLGYNLIVVPIIAATKESRRFLKSKGFKNVFISRNSYQQEDGKGLYKSGKALKFEGEEDLYNDGYVDLIIVNNSETDNDSKYQEKQCENLLLLTK